MPLLLALAGCGDGDKADPVSLVGHRSAIADAMVGLADDGLVEVKDGTGDLAGATTALTAAIRQASADGVDAAYLNQQIDEAESMGDLASRCSSCLDLLEGARP